MLKAARTISALAVVVAVGVALAPPAVAALSPPALAGAVRDVCTGRPLAGAGLWLVPLSGQTAPAALPSNAFGLFALPVLAPGDWALAVAASGYGAIGNPAPHGQTPGVPLAIPGGTPILPGGASVAAHLLADVRIAPLTPTARARRPRRRSCPGSRAWSATLRAAR